MESIYFLDDADRLRVKSLPLTFVVPVLGNKKQKEWSEATESNVIGLTPMGSCGRMQP